MKRIQGLFTLGSLKNHQFQKDIGELSSESFDDGGEDERPLLDWGEEACELIANLSKEIYTIVEENKI